MISTPIPIRLDRAIRTRIKNAASDLGLNRSALIRLAIHNQLTEIEAGFIRLRGNPVQKRGES